MYISYDYYRIFYYVAKYGNLSQAAKQLLNNQPNMTRAIKNLEAELGCPLFLRTNRGMKLTPEGERLYAHVRIAFEHIEAGEAEITESRTLQTGTVYVAASEVALRCLLLPVLKKIPPSPPRHPYPHQQPLHAAGYRRVKRGHSRYCRRHHPHRTVRLARRNPCPTHPRVCRMFTVFQNAHKPPSKA